MKFFLLFLGLIDACVALLLYFGPNFPLIGAFVVYFAYMILIKGIISISTSFPLGYFDWMGILDVIAGVCLIFISYGMNYQFFGIFSLIYILKTIYVLTRTIFNF